MWTGTVPHYTISATECVHTIASRRCARRSRRSPRLHGAAGAGDRPRSSSIGGTVHHRERTRARCSSPGAVAIDGTDIVDVDRPEAIAARYTAAPTIDARDQIVLPGLINTHTHAPMVMYRGLADDLALMDWLQKYIFPAEAKTVSPGVRPHRHAAGRARDDRVGHDDLTPTCITSRRRSRRRREKPACAACSARRSSSFRSPTRRRRPKALARAEAFIKAFKDDSLIVPAVAPHAMYTLDRATLRGRRRAGPPLRRAGADPPRRDGRRSARRRATEHQATPTGYLESIGFWGPKTLAAHGVWVTDEDIADPEAPQRRRLAQPREQHEAGERHRAGREVPRRRRRARPRHRRRRQQQRSRHVRGDAAGGVPRASSRRTIRPPCRRRRRSTWRRSAAPERSGWSG